MADLTYYYFTVTRQIGLSPYPTIPLHRLDYSLATIFNDLTCTTKDKKNNQDKVPQEMSCLGLKGNFGVWRVKCEDTYYQRLIDVLTSAGQKAVVPPVALSLDDLANEARQYLATVAKESGIAPNLEDTLTKLKAVNLDAHPIFFDAVRDNYVDVFRLDQVAFRSWVLEYATSVIMQGLVYDVNHDELRVIKEYLDKQPFSSEVHLINRLYSAAAAAFFLEQILPEVDETKPINVLKPRGGGASDSPQQPPPDPGTSTKEKADVSNGPASQEPDSSQDTKAQPETEEPIQANPET